jgi:hypothetical protein
MKGRRGGGASTRPAKKWLKEAVRIATAIAEAISDYGPSDFCAMTEASASVASQLNTLITSKMHEQ